MNHSARHISVFLTEGTPQGVLTAEIKNWTGKVVLGPRTKIANLVQRSELNSTGVYFLTGSDLNSHSRSHVYVGESDIVKKRLEQHNRDEKKDFWDRVCVVTSKDSNLTKAHARFLESRFVEIAKDSGMAEVLNENTPPQGTLPEADSSDMEYFIQQTRLVLPVLGLDFLREKLVLPASQETDEAEAISTDKGLTQGGSVSPMFILRSHIRGIEARARVIDGVFVVQAGSGVNPVWVGVEHNYKRLHQQLLAAKEIEIKNNGNNAVFKNNVEFRTPSAASAVIYGRADNGRVSWKMAGNESKTYADWQEEQVNLALQSE